MVGTAGWTLDEQGRAMSKSLGNGVDPVDIADRLGAEIVRLWVASVDFREDVVSSEPIMQRLAENYRKLRNTFRFLLGNLADFEPARDAVADSELLPLDRYMLARARELVEKVSGVDGKGGWYGDFQFHRVYHAINEFCIVDLSAFYLDILKDRLYTFAPKGVERRSAQTVLWRITEALVRLVAPILTFTADEVWQYLPAVSDRPASVHLALFPKADDLGAAEASLLDEWTNLLAIREQVFQRIEAKRQEKTIGKSLEAKICIYARGSVLDLLRRYEPVLEELLNVSKVAIVEVDPSQQLPAGDMPSATFVLLNHAIVVSPADGHKCDRCWRYYPDDSPEAVRQFGSWPNVCGRCADALRQMGYSENAP
jgi:isoleucyl-tRNA synthetase